MPRVRSPFRGKLPKVSRTTSEDSPEISRANINRTAADIQRAAIDGQEHSDIGPRGESLRGGGNDYTTKVSFAKADIPVFISHNFGYTVYNWTQVGKCGPGDIYEPEGSKYRPTKNGIWLACTVAACKARIRMDGQEPNK